MLKIETQESFIYSTVIRIIITKFRIPSLLMLTGKSLNNSNQITWSPWSLRYIKNGNGILTII